MQLGSRQSRLTVYRKELTTLEPGRAQSQRLYKRFKLDGASLYNLDCEAVLMPQIGFCGYSVLLKRLHPSEIATWHQSAQSKYRHNRFSDLCASLGYVQIHKGMCMRVFGQLPVVSGAKRTPSWKQ